MPTQSRGHGTRRSNTNVLAVGCCPLIVTLYPVRLGVEDMPTQSRGHGTQRVVTYLVVNYLLKVVDQTTPSSSYFPFMCGSGSAAPVSSDSSQFLNLALTQ